MTHDVIGFMKSELTYGDKEWHESWRDTFDTRAEAERVFNECVGMVVRHYTFKRVNRDTFEGKNLRLELR